MRRNPQSYRPSGPVEEDARERQTPTSRSGLFPFGPPGLTRRELVLIAVVVAVGVALRVAALSHSAIEHFDEGVYASNIYFGPPDYAYPMQRFYAPPLLPVLIETAMTAGALVGISQNLAALLPSFAAGCGTIVAVWWLGRFWFSPAAGIAAATLAALSDFHIAFSTASLTDVMLGLWLILAVDAIGRSLLNADFRWAIGAGIYTGLAWWTKYNGWLPLAIEVAALPLLWLSLRPEAQQRWKWLCCFMVTALFAGGIWAPYYSSLLPQGGYAPIAENHAKYVVGWSGWLDSAARQFVNVLVIEGPASKLSVAVAWIAPMLLAAPNWRRLLWRACQAAAIGLFSALTSSFVVIGIGVVMGLVGMGLSIRGEGPSTAATRRQWIGLALVGIWWAAMLAATPLYFPYLRLALPYMMAAWLAAGLTCGGTTIARDRELLTSARGRWQWFVVYGTVGAAVLAALAICHPHRKMLELPVDRRGIQFIASQARGDMGADTPRVAYVYGEPAAFFQLHAAGEEIVVAVADVPTAPARIDGRAAPTFLIDGPHADRDPQFQQQWTAASSKWKLVGQYEYLPSALVWLDLHDPRIAAAEKPKKESLRLYRYQD
jgi:dolichyl-phosphate-mannose-protein mannosyltransferase